jgi:hypothetical protein
MSIRSIHWSIPPTRPFAPFHIRAILHDSSGPHTRRPAAPALYLSSCQRQCHLELTLSVALCGHAKICGRRSTTRQHLTLAEKILVTRPRQESGICRSCSLRCVSGVTVCETPATTRLLAIPGPPPAPRVRHLRSPSTSSRRCREAVDRDLKYGDGHTGSSARATRRLRSCSSDGGLCCVLSTAALALLGRLPLASARKWASARAASTHAGLWAWRDPARNPLPAAWQPDRLQDTAWVHSPQTVSSRADRTHA